MLDIHTHILPGVDDGARSHRQAIQMLHAARSAGIDVLVATPHLNQPMADLSCINDAFCWLKPYAEELGIRLLKGYEVSYKMLLNLPCSELYRYCILGTNILLLELDRFHLFPQWDRVLSTVVREGYEPVIVHPERYVYIQEHLEIIEKMKRYGCRIQIDALAFLKPPWNKERRTAGQIKQKGWMDYLASDAHCPQDYRQMRTILKKHQCHMESESISIGSIPGLLSS